MMIDLGAYLYLQHVSAKTQRFQDFCSELQLSGVVLSSGQQQIQFMDDMAYPFKANVYFKEWLPLVKRYNSFLYVPASGKPSLYLDVAEDIWHTQAQQLPEGWQAAFDIIEFDTLPDIGKLLAGAAYIGEQNEFGLPQEQCNPVALRQKINYHRRFKTDYEHECIRKANLSAAAAHLAAKDAFYAKASELEIKFAYLAACGQADDEMPYSIIAGLNEHAAILHHFILDNVAPRQHRSFLIDAGVEVNGYASDITRTWAFDESSEYAEMIDCVDTKQLELVASIAAGGSGVQLHELSHLKMAEVLQQFSIINCSAQACVESGLSTTFYPHGIGHGLGVNVHELGGYLANADGGEIPPPEAYPRLRNTSDFAAGSVNTVEPGVYFIPSLLEKLKASDLAGNVNWDRIDEFLPYGGVRIEDNVLIGESDVENITRSAFKKCSAL
ncbi:MAG: Xaa-Pro dipeptidase [Pseudomonadales bacterium]